MSSRSSTKNHKRLFSEIETYRAPLILACDFYFQRGFSYIIAKDRSSKCSIYQKRGHKCVTTSWESLDHTRAEKAEAISKDLALLKRRQQEMSELVARLSRNRKALKLAEARAKQRTIQLSKQLEEEEKAEEQQRSEDPISLHADLSSLASVAGWDLAA